jgi:hypothetical protein
MTVATTLFPPANRQTAIVAFLRTVWQVIKGTGVVGASGYVVVTSAQIANINLQGVLVWVGALLLSALMSGAFAASNILINGLPASYVAAAVATIPAAVVTDYVPEPVPPAVVAPLPAPAVVAPVAPAAPIPPADATVAGAHAA